jgi:hypothetical protein
MQQILVKLNTAASDTGPFMIYSNVDEYVTAYGVNISKTALLVGVTVTVPDFTTSVKIRSNGKCTNSIIVNILPTTTTTTTRQPTTTTSTTTSTSTSTSTSTTSSTSTSTTTSTTTSPVCQCYSLENITGLTLEYQYTPCGSSELTTVSLPGNNLDDVCSKTIPLLNAIGIVITGPFGTCTTNSNCIPT